MFLSISSLLHHKNRPPLKPKKHAQASIKNTNAPICRGINLTELELGIPAAQLKGRFQTRCAAPILHLRSRKTHVTGMTTRIRRRTIITTATVGLRAINIPIGIPDYSSILRHQPAKINICCTRMQHHRSHGQWHSSCRLFQKHYYYSTPPARQHVQCQRWLRTMIPTLA